MEFIDDHLLRTPHYEFHCDDPIRHLPEGRVPVLKPRGLVEDYITLCEDLQPARIVELGIHRGGSTVLLAELARPERLVAVELATAPEPVLASYIDERDAAARVRPHFGVDQGDPDALQEIVAREFVGHPLDLVIDDASHLYEPTRTSFEVLFPHLRTDGLYIIENWRWQHRLADGMAAALENSNPAQRAAIEQRLVDAEAGRTPPTTPLSRLGIEMILACASSATVVAEVVVGPHWVQVRRGDEGLDPSAFRLDDLFEDHFNLLAHSG